MGLPYMRSIILSILSLFTFYLLLPSNAAHLELSSAQQPIIGSGLPKRLAIIGAGAAGSTTAYSAREFANTQSVDLNITVYEKNDYVGGRSTTVYAYDNPSEPVELGASIFVRVNYNLYDAAKRFGLEVLDAGDDTAAGDDELGVWDGTNFVFTQSTGGYWDVAKMFWRYGFTPLKLKKEVKGAINTFLKMYEAPVFPWHSLTDTVMDLGLTPLTSQSGLEAMKSRGISLKFAHELVQAATRVNYAANLPNIHGLETMVSMASNAMAIKGGNWQIFKGMIGASNANLLLNTPVTNIVKNDNHTWTVESQTTNEHGNITSSSEIFDAVVIAGPYQYTGIHSKDIRAPEEIEYVQLHVTLFASPHRLSPKYFNSKAENVPNTILTTLPTTEDPLTAGVGPSGFFSISRLRTTLRPMSGGNQVREEYLYKIFSPKEWKDEQIHDMLGVFGHVERRDSLTWTYRKVWNSYPVEKPRASFQEQQLDFGLWYTAGMESFISTMETNSLSGKNVAANIINGWVAEDKSRRKTHSHSQNL